jgi:hypothetical protein
MIRKLLPLLVSVFLTSLVGVPSAGAATFSFSQSGFEEGASVSGSFTGDDSDLNGQLSFFTGEISDFAMSFSGNSLVPAFSLGFGNLTGLVYDLDGGPLGDGFLIDIEGIAASDPSFSYSVGPGPVAECGIGIPCAFINGGGGFSQSAEFVIVGAGGAAGSGSNTAVTPGTTVASGEVLTQTASVVPTLIAGQIAGQFFGAPSFRSKPSSTTLYQQNATDIGLAAGDGLARPSGFWASYSRVNVENNLSSTAFDSNVSIFLGGFDWLITDALVAGFAIGHEDADTSTFFNGGQQDVTGVTFAGYAGYMLSPNWSIDATIGGADVNTEQFRTLGPLRIDSEVDSWRFFAAGNLNSFHQSDRWMFSSQFGLLYSRDDFDSFVENTGVPGGLRNKGRDVDIGQLSIGADLGYDYDGFVPYVNVRYVYDFEEINVTVGPGQPQPANDQSEFQIGFGMRYFGASNVSGFVELMSVQGREDIDNFTVTATVRIEL